MAFATLEPFGVGGRKLLLGLTSSSTALVPRPFAVGVPPFGVPPDGIAWCLGCTARE